MTMRFQKFTAIMKSWDDIFGEAAEFASRLPTDRVLTISHSCDNSEGVVAVWFWATDEEFKEWTKG